MTKPVVAVVRAALDYSDVGEAVRQAVELCGGTALLDSILPGQKLLVKPNLVETSNGESGNTTDYRVIEALIKLASPRGADITVGDSSGLRWHGATERALKDTGIRDVCECLGATVVSFDGLEPVAVAVPDGETLSEAYLARPAVEADLIIDAPKLKTHILTKTTGAVKNLFGTVPGGTKSAYHALGTTHEKFAALIVDIYSVLRPGLCVMDAIVGLGGRWREQDRVFPGLILASTDGVALDAVAAAILGTDPKQVPILVNASRRGLGVADLDQIEVVGESLETVVAEMAGQTKRFTLPSIAQTVSGIFLRQERPELLEDVCTGCGHCPRACPVGAVTVVDGKPVFDYEKCVRCFCCIELCPQRALRVTRGPIGNLFLKR
jgi:uncharacterized protein (DUF362 family)/Pyruvate/2-oxoacid:ferredoxin oxidoreductase delta subunit